MHASVIKPSAFETKRFRAANREPSAALQRATLLCIWCPWCSQGAPRARLPTSHGPPPRATATARRQQRAHLVCVSQWRLAPRATAYALSAVQGNSKQRRVTRPCVISARRDATKPKQARRRARSVIAATTSLCAGRRPARAVRAALRSRLRARTPASLAQRAPLPIEKACRAVTHAVYRQASVLLASTTPDVESPAVAHAKSA